MKTLWIFLFCLVSSVVNAKPIVHGSDRQMSIVFPSSKNAKMIDQYLPSLLNLPPNEVEFKTMPWKRVIKSIESGTIDIMGPLARDPRKEAYLIYTEPLIVRDMMIWYKLENSHFKKKTWQTLNDIKTYSIVYVLGYYYGQEFENFLKDPEVKKMEVLSLIDGMKALATGQADFFVSSETIINEYSEKVGARRDQFACMPKAIESIPFVLGISKKSPLANKLTEINKRIIKFRKEI